METTKKEKTEAELIKDIKDFIKWLYPILKAEGKERIYKHYYFYKQLEKNKKLIETTKTELEKYLKEEIPDEAIFNK